MSSTNPLSGTSTPSLMEMAYNLANTGKDVVKTYFAQGVILAEESLAKQRWEMCWGCEYFLKEDTNNTALSYRCSKCGCMMKTKVRLQGAKCPINKW